jgi:HEAT repeat protein
VRLVSFDAERDRATAGALLEPGWCVQLTAEVRGAGGSAVKGVPVSFRLDRRTGRGTVLGAALSHEVVLTGPDGAARALLVSSDLPERCRAYATCGPVTLGAAVTFTRRRPPEFTVGLAGPREPERVPWSPEAELDARVARLVRAFGRGGEEAGAVRREVTAMGRGAIGPLLRMIYDEGRSAGERQLAARVLAIVKDELVLDRLVRSLDDPRAAVRAGAETGLFERGAARAGRNVRRAAALAGPFGRASALRVLASWGRPEDVALLAARCGTDPDPLVRASAAWKLKAFRERAEARVALRSAMTDRSAFVRYVAARAQSLTPAIADRAAAPLLAGWDPREPDPRVRAAVALACRTPDCAGLLRQLVADRDVRVRRAATESMGLLPPGEAPEVWERLRQLAGDRDVHVAGAARRALVTRGGADCSGDMVQALYGRDAALAAAALTSLERIYFVDLGRPRPGARPSVELRNRWKRWVEACGDLKPFEQLWLAAERTDSRLRGEALLEMVRAGGASRRALQRAGVLAAALSGSADARVRAPACAARWLLGDDAGRTALLTDLRSPEWPARFSACRPAGLVGDREVALALVALLGDDSAVIRAAAHRALLRMRGEGESWGFRAGASPEESREARSLWKRWAGALRIRRRGPQEKGRN